MPSITGWEIIDALIDGDMSRFPGAYVLGQGSERNR